MEHLLLNRDELGEQHAEMILWDGLDAAVVGYQDTDNGSVAVYDYEAMVQCFVNDNDWPRSEAVEWIDFNIVGAYVGDRAPRIIHRFEFDG